MSIIATVLQLLGFLLIIAAAVVASPVLGLATAGFVALIVGLVLDREAS